MLVGRQAYLKSSSITDLPISSKLILLRNVHVQITVRNSVIPFVTQSRLAIIGVDIISNGKI